MRLGSFLSFLFHLAILLLIIIGLPDLFRQEEIVAAPVTVQLATLADISGQPVPKPPIPKPVVKQDTPPPPPAPAPPTPPTPPEPIPQPVEAPPPAPTPPPPQPPAPQQPAETTPPEPIPLPTEQPTPPPPQEAKLEAPPPPVLRPPVPPDKPKPQKPAATQQSFDSLLKNVEQMKTSSPDTQQPPQPDTQSQPDNSVSDLSAPQMTSSEKDAISSQMRGCWFFDAGAQGVGQMTVDVHVVLLPDGSVKSVQADGGSRMATDPVYRSFVEATVRAVWKCNPMHVPPDKYGTWKQLLLHFDPSGMIG